MIMIKKLYFKRKVRKNIIKRNLKYIILLLLSIIIIIINLKTKSIIFHLQQNNFINRIIKPFISNISNISNISKIINDYLSPIPSKYDKQKEDEKKRLEKFLTLIKLTNNTNKTIYSEAKTDLLNVFIKFANGKNFTSLNTLFLTQPANFGNGMQMLNNLIYYCEILGCKNIYLNSNYNWYIKDKVITNKVNISLMDISQINCYDINTLCFSLMTGFCLYPEIFMPEVRINLLKNEIHKNLPKVEVDKNDLYIHIRSGDIFYNYINEYFPQPPLCFYQNILYNFKFRKIYLISVNNNNPVIDKLLKEFPKIIFRNNQNLNEDMSLLANTYNLVGSTSSFLHSLIILNDNIKNYWEYNIYRKSEKYAHLHFDVFKYQINFTIYKMEPSENYKNEFFVWQKSENQLRLMIEEKCINNFIIIKPIY